MKQKLINAWNSFKSKFQKEKNNTNKKKVYYYTFKLTEPYYSMVNKKIVRVLRISMPTLTLTKVNEQWLCYCPFYGDSQEETYSCGIFLPIQITDEDVNKIVKENNDVKIMSNKYNKKHKQ